MTSCRALVVCCLLALAAGVCQCGYLALNSTKDLRRVYASLPDLREHSLLLLHLFANEVVVYGNNQIRPSSSFNPTTDFGSHYYGNKEGVFDRPPRGCRFHSLGSVTNNQCSASRQCPSYFKNTIGQSSFDNRGRLVLCLDNNNSILKVYLTQHLPFNSYNSAYDRRHTFEISPQLLAELSLFHFRNSLFSLRRLRDAYDQNIDNTQLNNIVNVWTRFGAPLGLLLRLVLFFSNSRPKRNSGSELTPDWKNICELQDMYVQASAGDGGYMTIRWEDIPQSVLKAGAAVAIFNSDTDQTARVIQPISTSRGISRTSKGMGEKFQARLLKSRYFFSWLEICRGPEFQNPAPVPVTNYAQLQLFVRNGYSCFRLYIENCADWKTDFSQAWVGLYTSPSRGDGSYLADQWQYVTRFKRRGWYGGAETYEYCTGTVVVPGLQARFMIKDYERKASTGIWPPWWNLRL